MKIFSRIIVVNRITGKNPCLISPMWLVLKGIRQDQTLWEKG